MNPKIEDKMKRLVILLSFLAIVSIKGYATAQQPDYIFYNGKKYALHTNPLESFFEKYPERRPNIDGFSEELWRGYIATFEIENGEMLLKDIEVEIYNDDRNLSGTKSVKDEVFPSADKIKIEWFDGLLVCPYGEVLNYVDMGYSSTYSNYLLIKIDKGNLISTEEYTGNQFEKFREEQFQALKETREYKQALNEMKSNDPNRSDKEIEDLLRILFIDYINIAKSK